MSMPKPTRIHLGKLPYRATIEDIEKFICGYGRIIEIVPKQGFAFVEFDNPRDAEDAIKDLNGREMYGMSVTVQYAQHQVFKWDSSDKPASPHHSRHSRSPTAISPRCARSPRAAEWYSGLKAPKKSYESQQEGSRERHSSRRRSHSSRDRRRDRSLSTQHSRRSRRSAHSRSRSPLRTSRRSWMSPVHKQSSSSRKEPLPNLDFLEDAMDEYEEEERGELQFFKLLQHRQELEKIARDLSLDINVRPFDGSIAFGGVIPVPRNRPSKVKQEPSTSAGVDEQEMLEKWMVFADKGPAVLVTSYERNCLVKEHTVPKFEWEPFSAAIKGMCEKFLVGNGRETM